MSTGLRQGIGRSFARANRLSARFLQYRKNQPLRKQYRATGTALPPDHFIRLVAGTADLEWFLHSGKLAAHWITQLLAEHGHEIHRYKSILDFGCGVGRVLRHFSDLRETQLHGTDQNPELVSWCRLHLRFAHFNLNGVDRALPYHTQSIDFIYALSVFTHLSESLQHFWIGELSRILRPGGILLLTTHGDCYRDDLSAHERSHFDQGHLVVQQPTRPGSNHCATFHPPSYVQKQMIAGFDLLQFQPEGALANPRQDFYLLRKQ